MFLDDEIVQVAKDADWTQWQTRSIVEKEIEVLVLQQFIAKSDLLKKTNGNDHYLIIEMTKVKRMYNLAIQRLKQKNIYISLTWDKIISSVFTGEYLVNTLTNLK